MFTSQTFKPKIGGLHGGFLDNRTREALNQTYCHFLSWHFTYLHEIFLPILNIFLENRTHTHIKHSSIQILISFQVIKLLMSRITKNLRVYFTCKLTTWCQSSMDASRRHDTLRSETKDSLILTATKEAGSSVFLCWPLEPQSLQSDAEDQVTPSAQWVVLLKRNLLHREPGSFTVGNKYLCSLF